MRPLAAATPSALRGFVEFSDLPAVHARGDWPGREELGAFTDILSIVTLLALVTALVLIASTMTTLVGEQTGEQTGEIATLKAVGARRRDIATIYLRTALALGALGAVVGIGLGMLLAWPGSRSATRSSAGSCARSARP